MPAQISPFSFTSKDADVVQSFLTRGTFAGMNDAEIIGLRNALRPAVIQLNLYPYAFKDHVDVIGELHAHCDRILAEKNPQKKEQAKNASSYRENKEWGETETAMARILSDMSDILALHEMHMRRNFQPPAAVARGMEAMNQNLPLERRPGNNPAALNIEHFADVLGKLSIGAQKLEQEAMKKLGIDPQPQKDREEREREERALRRREQEQAKALLAHALEQEPPDYIRTLEASITPAVASNKGGFLRMREGVSVAPEGTAAFKQAVMELGSALDAYEKQGAWDAKAYADDVRGTLRGLAAKIEEAAPHKQAIDLNAAEIRVIGNAARDVKNLRVKQLYSDFGQPLPEEKAPPREVIFPVMPPPALGAAFPAEEISEMTALIAAPSAPQRPRPSRSQAPSFHT